MICLKRWLLAGVLALTAAPLAAQDGEHPRLDDEHRPQLVEGRAFRLLLERREQLGLSEAQVQRLTVIQRRLEAANGPLRERLAAERERFLAERRAQLERMTPEERRAERERMRAQGRPPLPPSMRPLADEMATNIRAAMREAHGVLTPRQRMEVRRMVRAQMEQRGPGGRARRGAWRGRRQP